MELKCLLNALKTIIFAFLFVCSCFVVVVSPKHHKVAILSKMKPQERIRKRKKSLNQNMKS